MLKNLLCVALLASSGVVFAQTPSPDTQKPSRAERRFDCSKAKDPKACEERMGKVKAAQEKARQACEGRKGDEARDCMRREMCSQTKDPAKCEARVRDRVSQRAKLREACKGKEGDELRSCIRDQRQKK
jgi:hypothetical protein